MDSGEVLWGRKEGDSPAPGPRGQRSVAPRTLNLLVTYCSKTGNQGLNDLDGASAKLFKVYARAEEELVSYYRTGTVTVIARAIVLPAG